MNKLISYSGSFWSEINEDKLYDTVVHARAETERQTTLDANTLSACITRETTPLYRTVLLQPITLRKSEVYPDNTWRLKENLVGIPYITDKIVSPQVLLLHGFDFKVQDGTVTFRDNPFNSSFTPHPLHDDHGNVRDEAITVWVHNADYDEHYLSDIWGAPFGIHAPSSEEYRDLLCALHAITMHGTTRRQLEKIVASFTGGTHATTDEVITTIVEDSHGLFVATDKAVYRAPGTDKPLGEVGTRLKAGDQVFDTCLFYTAWQVPDSVKSITVPETMLDPFIDGYLTFLNSEVAITASGGGVFFPGIQGPADSIQRFWMRINARGVDGVRLVDVLSKQQTINPMRFVLDNVLRNNTLVCVVTKPIHNLQGIDLQRLLRLVVPPHMTLLVTN